MTTAQSFHALPVTRLDGSSSTLADYTGKVVLVVNVASACGLTPQYEGLEALYRKYGARGLVVLGVPSNQFGAQEPGTAEQIKSFCESRFDVTFPLLAKSDVNGPNAHPLYVQLKGSEAGGGADISWNFEKFLVGKNGEVRKRFSPRTTPDQLEADIEQALEA
jgi:glutathione peroxidase